VLRRVRDQGAMISIGADAHNVAGISYVDYGVAMARKGWLGPDDILNARPVDEFLTSRRGSGAAGPRGGR
jgi:DNA polymerase (family 10)